MLRFKVGLEMKLAIDFAQLATGSGLKTDHQQYVPKISPAMKMTKQACRTLEAAVQPNTRQTSPILQNQTFP